MDEKSFFMTKLNLLKFARLKNEIWLIKTLYKAFTCNIESKSKNYSNSDK